MKTKLAPLALVGSLALFATNAAAHEAAEPHAHEHHQYGPKPFHYSLPFQLRPAITWNVARSDTAYGMYEVPSGASAGTKGSLLVTSLLVGYKVTEEIQPFVRVAYTSNSPPIGDSGTALSNPLAGVTYGIKPGEDLRLALTLAFAMPWGQGGGAPEGDIESQRKQIARASAQGAANATRFGMDGALFAVNDLAIAGGGSFAWIAKGFTVQVEATYVQLMRMRGNGDSAKAVMTGGLHVGYFIIPQLSVGAEIRHQRFLTTPVIVNANDAARDNTSVALGVRAHIPISNEKFWLRPGAAFAMPLDNPLSDQKLKVIQIDIPFVF